MSLNQKLRELKIVQMPKPANLVPLTPKNLRILAILLSIHQLVSEYYMPHSRVVQYFMLYLKLKSCCNVIK